MPSPRHLLSVNPTTELTAETLAQAWLSRTRFRDLAAGSPRPWLYAIARHVLVASVRARVDATKHVNGSCRPDFLGEYAPTPGVGRAPLDGYQR